ncbi:MAG: hypothetical protein QM692_09285 [Thermomicrobiales bacterium]
MSERVIWWTLDDQRRPVPTTPIASRAERDRADFVVAVDAHLPGNLRATTMFLRLDHGNGATAPILWETSVFGDDTRWWGYLERYTSEAEALAGHARIVARIRETERIVATAEETWQEVGRGE